MISVTKKNHMPSVTAWLCCSASSNWWATAPCALDTGDHLLVAIIVRAFGDDRRLVEVRHGRRRGRLPLEAGRIPRIRPGLLAISQRPDEIDERDQISDPEDRRAR